MLPATLDPTAIQIASWLAVAFFLAAGVNQIWKLIQRFKDKPPPAEIYERVNKTFAPRTMVEGLQVELHSLRDETHRAFEHQTQTLENKMEANRIERREELRNIETRLDAIMEKGEERAVNLHNRINPVVENTALIKGQMEAFTDSFRALFKRDRHE